MLPRLKWFYLFGLLLVLMGMTEPPHPPDQKEGVDIEVFVQKGCPHCESAKRFLNNLQREHPHLRIYMVDVSEQTQALARLKALARQYGVKQIGVPTFFIRQELIVGYESENTTGKRIQELLSRPPPSSPEQRSPGLCDLASKEGCSSQRHSPEAKPPPGVEIPFLGHRGLTDLGLPLFTLVLGLLDGFNPCAMWVLLFLLSLLATLRDRKKMALIAGTFVLMSGVVYFVFMAAWLNVFLVIGYSRGIQVALAMVALLIGAINIKDGMGQRKEFALSIPKSAKPGLYVRLRRIIQAEHLAGALVSVIVLAAFVNVIELACTAGFPAMYTEILSLQGFPAWKYYSYLVIYNLAYIADDVLMVGIGVITLSHQRLQAGQGRWLKSISGIVMVGLGVILLFVPNWLI